MKPKYQYDRPFRCMWCNRMTRPKNGTTVKWRQIPIFVCRECGALRKAGMSRYQVKSEMEKRGKLITNPKGRE